MFFNKLKELVEKSKKKIKQNNEIEKLKMELEKEINNIKIDNNEISEVLLEVGSLYSELKSKFSKKEDDEKCQKDIADKIDSLFHQKISKIKADDKEESVKDLAIDFALIITAMSGIDVSSVPKFVANMENKNYDDISSRLNFLLKKLDLDGDSRKIFNEIMKLIDNKLSEVQKEVTESIRGSKITVVDSEFKDCRSKADWQQVFQEWINNSCKNEKLRRCAQEICNIKIDNSKGWIFYEEKDENFKKLLNNINLILKQTDTKDYIYLRSDIYSEYGRIMHIMRNICKGSKKLKQDLKNEEDSDLAVIMTYIHNMTKWSVKQAEYEENNQNKEYRYAPEREKIDLKNLKLWDSDGPKAADVKQQDIGDCYFKAVLKNLVSSYDFRKCFVGGVNKENGSIDSDRIEVRLFKVKVTKYKNYYKVEPNGQQIIEIESSVFLTEMQKNFAKLYWPYVLIKAYAIMRTTKGMIELGEGCEDLDEVWRKNVRKITGYSTKFIAEGYSSMVQCALTGRKAMHVDNDTIKIFNSNKINKILSRGGSITVAFRKYTSYSSQDLQRFDIEPEHAYSVVKASKENGIEYLYLEDPRGNNKRVEDEFGIDGIKIMNDGIIRISKEIANDILECIEVSE